MCTITLFYKQLKDFPIILAQNRDSFETRSEQPPAKIGNEPTILAPIDIKSKGTWIGTNTHGLLLGLTNAYQPNKESNNTDASRGQLVLNALSHCKSPAETVIFVKEQIKNQKLNFFNLFCLSIDESYFIQYNGIFRISSVLPGVTYHYSSGYDSGSIKKLREERLLCLFSGFRYQNLEETLRKLKSVCRDHCEDNNPSEKSICMHGQPRRTISSSIFVIGSDCKTIFCEYLNGYPCQKEYERYKLK